MSLLSFVIALNAAASMNGGTGDDNVWRDVVDWVDEDTWTD